VVAEGLACPTADDAGWVRGQIDHLLTGASIEVLDLKTVPRVDQDGLRLSDHDGLLVPFGFSPPPAPHVR
jgi:hypothetical protein